MALAVLDFDIAALPETLPLCDHHDGAVVLLRIDGEPCGQAVLWKGAADRDAPLRDRVLRAAGSSFWERWLEHQLGLASAAPRPVNGPSATVAVCTRERPDDLERCLAGLIAMPGHPDILVVDNAPASDATRLVVERFAGVRYVVEPRAGLDYARNTAIAASFSEVIAFTDDDAVPDPQWLDMLLTNFADPLVMAACGLTMALELETEAQIAFQRAGGFGRGFKRVIHDAVTTDPYESWKTGAGVSIAIRRTVIEKVGLFDLALGAGTRAMAGDETDFFRRILKAGYRIAYDPRALNWHRHRRTTDELRKQILGYECGAFAILTKGILFERDPRAAAHLVRWFRQNLPGIGRGLMQKMRGQRGELPFNVQLVQALGALKGPQRYLQARAHARQTSQGKV